MFDVVQVEHGSRVQSEPSRDSWRTEFGKMTLSDRTPPPGESLLGPFARHGDAAARRYDNIANLWFMPAAPIRAPAGDRDSGILDRWTQSPGRPRRRRPDAPCRSHSPTRVPP